MTLGRPSYFRAGNGLAGDDQELPRSRVSAFPRSDDDVPLYPIGAIPGAAGRLVREAAAALDVSPAFVAMPLLAYAGGLLGRRYAIQVKPGWHEFPILFLVVVGPPASGKTPANGVARRAIDRLQREWQAEYKQEQERYREAMRENANAAPPIFRHAYINDATIESIAEKLETSPGVTQYIDELSGWVKSMNAYRGGKGSDRQRWLSVWSGDPWKVDRKGKDPILISAPVVCVIGGIQPDVLHELAHEAGRRDGFIERLLFAYPTEYYPDDTDATIDERTLERVYQVFKKLRLPGHDPDALPLLISLSPDARTLLRGWRKDNTRLVRESSGLMQGIAAKLPSQVARLALILHCLTYPEQPEAEPVAACTVNDAIDLVEYHRAHAARVLPRFGEVVTATGGSLVAKVARVLDSHGGAWLSRNDLRDKLHRNHAATDISQALERLAEQGRAESRHVRDGRAGRPKEEWRTLVNAGQSADAETR